MALNALIKTIRAKTEAVAGTPETLASTDGIEFIRASTTHVPIAGNTVEIDLSRADIDGPKEFITGNYSTITFDTLCDGGGTAVDTPPQWADLVQACATNETVTAATEVDYDPVSTSMDTVTIEYNADGQQQVMAGCRGTWEIVWAMNGVAMIRWTFWGKYAALTATAQPTIDLTGWQAGIVCDDVTWGTTTLHSQVLNVREFTFTLGNQMFHHQHSEGSEILITRRNPSANILFEKLAIGTFDPVSIALAHTQAAFSTSITGGAAGRLVEITGAQVQLFEPRDERVENIDMTRLRLGFKSSAAANDSFQLTTR